MALNNDRSHTDPFYRYKMPQLIAKDTPTTAAATAATPGKGKKGKQEKGGENEEKEVDRASPDTTVAAGQEQMVDARESRQLMNLPPTILAGVRSHTNFVLLAILLSFQAVAADTDTFLDGTDFCTMVLMAECFVLVIFTALVMVDDNVYSFLRKEIWLFQRRRGWIPRGMNAINRLLDIRHLRGIGHRPSDFEGMANCISHAAFIPVVAIGGKILYQGTEERDKQIVALLYISSVLLMLSISVVFHFLWYMQNYSRIYYRLKMLDHASMFLAVAATFTPWLCFKRFTYFGLETLVLTWVMAFVAVLDRFISKCRIRAIYYSPYATILVLVLAPGMEILIFEEERTGIKEFLGTSFFFILSQVFFEEDGQIYCAHAFGHVYVGLGVIAQMICIKIFVF